jgi:hypothetical protein
MEVWIRFGKLVIATFRAIVALYDAIHDFLESLDGGKDEDET